MTDSGPSFSSFPEHRESSRDATHRHRCLEQIRCTDFGEGHEEISLSSHPILGKPHFLSASLSADIFLSSKMTRKIRIAKTRGGLLTLGGLDSSHVAFFRYGRRVDLLWQRRVCCISELAPQWFLLSSAHRGRPSGLNHL